MENTPSRQVGLDTGEAGRDKRHDSCRFVPGQIQRLAMERTLAGMIPRGLLVV
jgi:hypothetical protein